MKANDILFEDYEMYINFDNYGDICLSILDYLEASEEELGVEYKEKISTFVNKIDIWHKLAIEHIKSYAQKKYNANISEDNAKLLNIFVLFEQDEEELFGLGFNVSFDEEHGCGLKIKGKSFEIIEIGEEDIAFC
ncbi:MAG: hypothetical protein KGV44_15490 [Flavobacteriaceae bacterium]|nr:hypothetical protein [Flavobacteriaceae bacterium]